MTQVKTRTTKSQWKGRVKAIRPSSADARTPLRRAPVADTRLEEVESIARIGSYSLDIASRRWVSSKGLDAIFGIDAAFGRPLDDWASLVHPTDRAMMVTYLSDEVIGLRRPFDKQYRIVRPDTGEERWVHGRGALELDGTQFPLRLVGTIADITDQQRAREALAASELRYAAIFEGTTEAILIAEVETKRFRWVNSAACALLGYTRDELLKLTARDIHTADVFEAVLGQFEALADRRTMVARSVSCRRKDGTTLLVDIKGSQAIVDGVSCNIGFFTDVTELRQLEARDHQLAQAVENASDAIMMTDPTAQIVYVNQAFERLSGLRRDEIVGRDQTRFGRPRSRTAAEAMWGAVSAGTPWNGDLVHRRSGGEERTVEASISPVRGRDGTVTGYVAIERDVTDERAVAIERQRFAAAIDQTSDPVIITDRKGTIEYVNPAFEQVSGYSRAEAIGQNPRIVKSGVQASAFYVALWRRLLHGQTWTGTLVNRRKDGSVYQVEATISPLRDRGGRITGYVAVQRDVTALRAAESALAGEFRERAEVAAAIADLQRDASGAVMAADICYGLVGLPGIDSASIITFLDPRRAVPLAVAGLDGVLDPGRPLPGAHARYLYEQAMKGPWAEEWLPRAEDGWYGKLIALAGIRAIAYAPIRHGERVLGVVTAGTRDDEHARHLIDLLLAVGEFAATASALLSDVLERGQVDDVVKAQVGRALAKGGLRPVLQPIVELGSRSVVGYEALTRFADGTPPDRMIGDAHSVGMGIELEVACLTAGLEAAETLPQDAWLSLNVSPGLILHPSELAVLLADRSRRIVLEVTEHAEIDDYAAVRRAIAGLGPNVSLAIDDAGAGVANLHHIVELAPRFLKLDLSLVRHIDRDLSRQAMIAGLAHYATRTGCEIIAEGIQDRAELEMLRSLGISFGQGNLLGRPEPSPAASRRPARLPRSALGSPTMRERPVPRQLPIPELRPRSPADGVDGPRARV